VTFKEKTEKEFPDLRFQAKLTPRLSYDGLDSPLNPTRGFFGTASLAYINALLVDSRGNSLGLGNFLKVESTMKFFVTLANTVTFAALLHSGWGVNIGGGGGARLPENERFRLGGQLGLRGYSDGGILRYDRGGLPVSVAAESKELRDQVPFKCAGEIDDGQCDLYASEKDGDVIVNGSIETRFPILRRNGVWGALFWDWGGLAANWDEMYALSIRHGVGFGLRWLISGQIPLRLDYGFAIGDRCIEPEDPSPFRECAREDFGQLNAGLMYSF